MEKNKKIALTMVPLAVLAVGAVIYINLFMGKPSADKTESAKAADAWVDDIKTDTAKKVNKIEAIRQTYQQQHVDQRLYEGIEFGGETVPAEPAAEYNNDKNDSIPNSDSPSDSDLSSRKQETPATRSISPARAFAKKNQKAPVNQPEKMTEKLTPPATLSPAPAPRVRKGFLSSSGAEQPPALGAQTLPCVVLENTQAQSGSVVNLLLLQEAVINGETIPKNTIIHAEASFSQNTMNLSASSIGSQAGNWIGYDMNGNKGFVIAGENSADNQLVKQTVGDVFDTGTDVISSKINVPLLSRLGTNAGRQKIQDASITIPKGFKVKLK